MRSLTRMVGVGLAAGGGGALALLGPQAPIVPMLLGVMGFLLAFSELSILLLQDYMPLVTAPLSRLVGLPAVQASLPFVALWAIAAAWRYGVGGARFRLEWGLLLHLAFALLAIANYLAVAGHTEYANSKLFLLLSLNMISYLAGATFTPQQVSRVFNWIMALGLAVGALTVYAFVTNDPVMPGRFAPPEMNPIWACRLLLLGAIAALFAGRGRWWSFAYLAFALPAALLTGSRGPLVAALATAFMLGLAWLFTPGSQGRRMAWGLAGAIGLGALVVAVPIVFGAPVSTPDVRNMVEGSTTETRVGLYELAFGTIAQHALFGLGFGGFRSEVDIAAVGEELTFPHNIFLEVGAELGLPGLALFGALVLYFFAVGRRHLVHALNPPPADRRMAAWGLAATVSFLFLFASAQFSGDLVSNHSLWFYMGLMTAVLESRRSACGSHATSPSPQQENLE